MANWPPGLRGKSRADPEGHPGCLTARTSLCSKDDHQPVQPHALADSNSEFDPISPRTGSPCRVPGRCARLVRRRGVSPTRLPNTCSGSCDSNAAVRKLYRSRRLIALSMPTKPGSPLFAEREHALTEVLSRRGLLLKLCLDLHLPREIGPQCSIERPFGQRQRYRRPLG